MSGGFKSAITLSATGLPAGVTATFAPASIASPGNGTSTVTLKAAPTTVAGVYTVTLKGVGGGVTKTQPVTLTLIVPTIGLAGSSASATVTAGSSTTFMLSAVAINGFNSPVALAVSGLPSGVTAKFAPSTIPTPGTGSSTLTLTAAANKVAGVYSLTLTASGGGVSKTQTLVLTVIGPDFTLSLAGAQVTVARGGSLPINVTTAAVNGFKSAVTLSISGLPTGVTATFSPVSITTPGSGTSVLTFKVAGNAAVKRSMVTVTASGGGATHSQTIALSVK